jgi:hypothetical protein
LQLPASEDNIVSFRKAVEETRGLAGAWKEGLQALGRSERSHVKCRDTRSLRGSVDIDTALQPQFPNKNRWDYAIGYQHSGQNKETVYWLEIHPSSDSEVFVVLQKLEWLRSWLEGDGRKLATFQREFVWMSSGSTTFTNTSRQKRVLAQKGIRHVGRTFSIS